MVVDVAWAIYVTHRGVMPIESEGARATLDVWAKWILNAAFKRQ